MILFKLVISSKISIDCSLFYFFLISRKIKCLKKNKKCFYQWKRTKKLWFGWVPPLNRNFHFFWGGEGEGVHVHLKKNYSGIKIGMREYLFINNQKTTQNTSNWYPDWKGVSLIINQPVRVHSVGYINWREVFCHQPKGRNTSNWYTDWNCRDIL